MAITFGSMRSKVGLSLQAVSADEDKARGIGVHVTGVKVLAFAVSVGLAAMVGGVWAYYQTFIYPQFAIDPLITIGMVLMAFLGGRATLWGPVLGAFLLVPGQQYLAYKLGGSQFYLIAYAAAFLLIMLVLPRGGPAHAGRPHPVPPSRPAAEPAAAREGPYGDSRRSRFRPCCPERGPGMSALLTVDGRHEGVRQGPSGRQLLVRRRGGQRHRADRAQRIREDHPVQPRHRATCEPTRAGSSSPGRT